MRASLSSFSNHVMTSAFEPSVAHAEMKASLDAGGARPRSVVLAAGKKDRNDTLQLWRWMSAHFLRPTDRISVVHVVPKVMEGGLAALCRGSCGRTRKFRSGAAKKQLTDAALPQPFPAPLDTEISSIKEPTIAQEIGGASNAAEWLPEEMLMGLKVNGRSSFLARDPLSLDNAHVRVPARGKAIGRKGGAR